MFKTISKFFFNNSIQQLFSLSKYGMADKITNQKKTVIIKPFTIQAKNMIFSITPIKGKYAQKQDYITLQNNGCILVEFIPSFKDVQNEKQVIQWENKKNFALSVGQIGHILGVSDSILHAGKDFEKQIDYTIQSTKTKKILTFSKKKDQQNLNVQLEYQAQNPAQNFTLQLEISIPHFLVVRELCRYSLPYLLGWQALSSYQIAEDDAQDHRY
eukprot:TRINITY_DN4517_c0_g1_i5.p2 TRINITY_DN4517_c0_g1~~TRINITY_DN4517_c0_g1_i5.p2  ORF type:complete len:214 (-),score=30.74 TRINITY_DN4517_c0_g1_i5:253-894(-)